MASAFVPADEPRPDPTAKTKVVTYLDAEVVARTKKQVLKVWDRVSTNKSLEQSALANALEMSQSGVSRLLKDMAGHPWTPRRLKQMAKFVGGSPLQFIDPVDKEKLRPFFEGWTKINEPSSVLLDECLSALTNFYMRQGVNPAPARLRVLAGKLAANLKNLEDGVPSKEEMETAMRRLVLQEAMEVSVR